jgi:hypothetical protein
MARASRFYRFHIALERQTVTAYGEEVPLQAGLVVEAECLLESRRLANGARPALHPDRPLMTTVELLDLASAAAAFPWLLQTRGAECGLTCSP